MPNFRALRSDDSRAKRASNSATTRLAPDTEGPREAPRLIAGQDAFGLSPTTTSRTRAFGFDSPTQLPFTRASAPAPHSNSAPEPPGRTEAPARTRLTPQTERALRKEAEQILENRRWSSLLPNFVRRHFLLPDYSVDASHRLYMHEQAIQIVDLLERCRRHGVELDGFTQQRLESLCLIRLMEAMTYFFDKNKASLSLSRIEQVSLCMAQADALWAKMESYSSKAAAFHGIFSLMRADMACQHDPALDSALDAQIAELEQEVSLEF